MRASHIALLVIAALVSVSACSNDDTDNPGGGTNDSDDIGSNGQAPPTVFEWRAALVATDIDSTINGVAVVQQRDGEASFTAMISIREDVPGSIRPWAVRFNTCESGGDIVSLATDYTNLGVGADGFSSTAAQSRVGLLPQAPYHVAVVFSDQMPDRVIACGDLILQ